MKWKSKKINWYGDKRIKSIFCILPRRINNELYWLETILIVQEFTKGSGERNYQIIHDVSSDYWEDIRIFSNDELD